MIFYNIPFSFQSFLSSGFENNKVNEVRKMRVNVLHEFSGLYPDISVRRRGCIR